MPVFTYLYPWKKENTSFVGSRRGARPNCTYIYTSEREMRIHSSLFYNKLVKILSQMSVRPFENLDLSDYKS